jgi:hypothetical protein
MGMLFNTPATLLLLKTLNDRYKASNIGTVRAGDLIAYSSANSLQVIWNGFGVSLNVAGSPNGDANWSTWLSNTVNIDTGTDTVHNAIKKAMVHHLNDKNCRQIEFFAYPSNQIFVHVPSAVPDPAGGHSCIVAVETVTFDKVASFYQFLRTKS